MEQDITFEEALAQLEGIVSSLEAGQLSLDESLKKFQEGIRLSRLCNDMLHSAQQTVEKLVEKDGEIVKEPMAEE